VRYAARTPQYPCIEENHDDRPHWHRSCQFPEMWFCLKLGADRGCAHICLMKQHNLPVVIQGLEITSITGTSANWDISADALPDPICPGCGTRSVSRHSRYERRGICRSRVSRYGSRSRSRGGDAATPIVAVPYSSRGCLTSLRSAPVVRGGLPKSSPSSATLPEGDQENG
jgi:hypothetical protein